MVSLAAAAFIGFLLPGVGPHSCVQFTDTGRVELHAEGLPDPGVSGWLSGSQNPHAAGPGGSPAAYPTMSAGETPRMSAPVARKRPRARELRVPAKHRVDLPLWQPGEQFRVFFYDKEGPAKAGWYWQDRRFVGLSNGPYATEARANKATERAPA